MTVLVGSATHGAERVGRPLPGVQPTRREHPSVLDDDVVAGPAVEHVDAGAADENVVAGAARSVSGPAPPMSTSAPSPPSAEKRIASAASARPLDDVVAGQRVDRERVRARGSAWVYAHVAARPLTVALPAPPAGDRWRRRRWSP